MARADGIVIESGRGWALIMNHEGRYLKIKTAQPLYPGQHYYAERRPALRYGIAAAVLLLLMAGTADFFNVVAYASVSPGIDLGINRWDRVVAVKTDSDEAAQVISGLDISGKTSTEAVATVVNEIIVNNPLPEGQTGSLKVSVHSKKNGIELEAEYKEKLVAQINSSVDGVLKLHEKITINNETGDKEVCIKYTTAAPGLTKKNTQEEQNGNTELGKNHGQDKNSSGNKNVPDIKRDNHPIPTLQRDAVTRGSRAQFSTDEVANGVATDHYVEVDRADSSGESLYHQWLRNRTQFDWRHFRNMPATDKEKSDK